MDNFFVFNHPLNVNIAFPASEREAVFVPARLEMGRLGITRIDLGDKLVCQREIRDFTKTAKIVFK